MPEVLVSTLVATLVTFALVALFLWGQHVRAAADRQVTVSLLDGSVLTGRTRAAWPGRLRLIDVQTGDGDVPGTVVVFTRHVLTVQVIA